MTAREREQKREAIALEAALRRERRAALVEDILAAVDLIHEHGSADGGIPFRGMTVREWRELEKSNPAEFAIRIRARNRYRQIVKAATAIAFIEKSEQRIADGGA